MSSSRQDLARLRSGKIAVAVPRCAKLAAWGLLSLGTSCNLLSKRTTAPLHVLVSWRHRQSIQSGTKSACGTAQFASLKVPTPTSLLLAATQVGSPTSWNDEVEGFEIQEMLAASATLGHEATDPYRSLPVPTIAEARNMAWPSRMQ